MSHCRKKYKKDILIRDKKLFDSVRKNCILTSRIENTKELILACNSFDLLICGSDQIWNPNWYNRFYFVDYDGVITRRISYAPSMGVNKIPSSIIPSIKRGINKFDYISVREKRAAELLASYTNKKIDVVFIQFVKNKEFIDNIMREGIEICRIW